MESEVVRDSLLYAAGRLETKMGGQELENSEALKTFRRSLYYATYPEASGKSEFGELFDGPEAPFAFVDDPVPACSCAWVDS